jgi:hypothetical protein
MQDPVIAHPAFHGYRLHHPTTLRRPIPRIDIYMPAPQTFRAMVCITIAFHFSSAMATDKILNVAFESFSHALYATASFNALATLRSNLPIGSSPSFFTLTHWNGRSLCTRGREPFNALR